MQREEDVEELEVVAEEKEEKVEEPLRCQTIRVVELDKLGG